MARMVWKICDEESMRSAANFKLNRNPARAPAFHLTACGWAGIEFMETKSAITPITITLVEDDYKTRKNLEELLRGESRVRCVGIYPNGEAAVREIPLLKPEVALVDINLPGISGIEC